MKNNTKKVLSMGILTSMLLTSTINVSAAVSKDETIYVNLDATGKVKSETVSNWLHDDENKGVINDVSILNDIINVKGEEKPEINGQNIIWKTEKNDIYYQGKTDKELPLEFNISYKLDGKDLKAEDIKGKSGEVEIQVTVENKLSSVQKISGKNKTIFTPFTTAVVVNLPLDNFKNIKVNSGELISDGNNQIVTFITVPGLKESLDTDKYKDVLNLDIPDTLRIKADVENFKMSPIVITATPDIPEIDEIDSADTIEELEQGVSDLKDASSQLVDGTKQLADGAKELSVNMEGLKSGLGDLYTGSSVLEDGTKKINDGLVGAKQGASDLAVGVQDLDTGATILSGKTGELREGLEELTSATSQIKAGQDSITAGAKESKEAIEKLKEGKTAELDGVNTLLAGVNKLVLVVDALPLPGDAIAPLKNGILGVKAGLEGLKGSSEQLLGGLNQLEQGIDKIEKGSATLSDNMAKLEVGQKQAVDGAKLLEQGTISLKAGVTKARGGAEALDSGLGELVEGSSGLKSGATELVGGLKIAEDGAAKLSDGSQKLYDGTTELSENMGKFDNEGINELNNKVIDGTSDIEELMDTKDAIVSLSKNYDSFSGKLENTKTKTKFIFKTEEIKAEVKADEIVEETEVKHEEKGGFFRWIKNLFK